MTHPDRPQAPGYLANLMARLVHEVSGEGLEPLGIAPAMFPILVELWFGDGAVTRQSLAASQEMRAGDVDALVGAMVAAGLIQAGEPLTLTKKGAGARDQAVAAARRANAAAASALSEEEMAVFVGMMNRVIDGLIGVRGR